MTTDLDHLSPTITTGVDLYWLPLGAGGHLVAWNGRVFEALVARGEHRPQARLFHSALEVRVDGRRWTVEMTPAWSGGGLDRGVVVEGPVGSRVLGRSVLFRYEVRRWRDGVVPDLDHAVGGAVHVTDDPVAARSLLEHVPDVPALVWGRDDARTGEMWNSNSITSWLLARSGLDTADLAPPDHGRAPGWTAGLTVARDHEMTAP